MLTNPVPLASPTRTETNRPPLRIAARSTQDGSEAEPNASVVIRDQVGGWHAQWRQTLQTMKETLAGLEQACDSAIDAREAEVSGLIETLVQGAAAEATTAADRTQEQAQIEIRELQQASVILRATVETLQAGIETERDNVKRLSAQLEGEGAARASAERERDELQRGCQGRIAAAEAKAEALQAELQAQKAELAVARQQLEAAFAERSKLTTTVRLIQRALALSVPSDIAVPAGVEDKDPIVSREGAQHRPTERSAAPKAPPEAPNPADAARRALIEAHPDAVEDITRMLEQVETLYHQDVESGRPGIEVVDRFTASLRHARSLIVGRWSTDTVDAQTLFRYHMDLLLEQRADTSFGRHLGMAAYALRTPAPSPVHEEPSQLL
jgi:hypothetical protein